jgi:aminopeptidase
MRTTTPTDLASVAYDPEFRRGAESAVFTCLAVKPGERVVLTTDRSCLGIGAALHEQFRRAGADLQSFVLEDVAERPLREFPPEVARALETATVSCFAATAQTGELQTRVQMCTIVNRRRIRHAHMVNVTPRIMCEGMRADFLAVDELSKWVMSRVVPAKKIEASTPAGTHLVATFDPKIRWLKTSGIISPDKWGNLPGGEVLTTPERVDGRYVVDGVLGDWLASEYGDMRAHPLVIDIADSRIVGTSCDRADILATFRKYVSTDENSNRVGEFALGTNIAVTDVIGQILQDEKIPGVHVAFGHPYGEHTGAPWKSSTHIDVVGRSFDVQIDGVPIMKASRYLVNGELHRG